RVDSSVTEDPHGVDAVRERRAGGQRDVGGGKSEAGAALGPASHHARYTPPPAQHLGGAPDVALPQIGANGARGEYFARFRNLTDDGYAEAQRVSSTPQTFGVAATALAEAEIVADHDLARGQRIDQHASDEVVRRQPGEARIEGEHDSDIDPEPLQQSQLQGQWRQPEVRLVGLEILARMGLEHDGSRRSAEPDSLIPRGLDERLVTAMHAIEVTDGERRAARGRR